METVYPRIQSRQAMANGGMYFGAVTEFSQGDDETYVYSVGLLNSVYWPIAGAFGSDIDGVFFNPSDQIEVAYMIDLSVTEDALTAVRTSYFQDLSTVMLGQLNITDYEAKNDQYFVPNQAVLKTFGGTEVDRKFFVPKGTGSFIGVSEGDLEWEASVGGGASEPDSVTFESRQPGASEFYVKIVCITYLTEELRDAYLQGTNIETRFSIELAS
jgi:hypothetical protein